MDLIGRGRYGKVYKVGDDRAVKVSKSVKTAMHEISVLSSLAGGRNVIEVIHHFRVGAQVWMVMPLCDGTLGDVDPPQKKELARQLLAAVKYVHEHDVSHNDIKPPNILLKDGKLLLADFGLASSLTRLTSLDIVTLPYRTPEHLKGCLPLDPRHVDIWAALASIFECCHPDGHEFFSYGNTEEEVFFNQKLRLPRLVAGDPFEAFLATFMRTSQRKRVSLEALMQDPYFKASRKRSRKMKNM